MLALTCERARIEDGQRILDLGCGWGSFALYARGALPAARGSGGLELAAATRVDRGARPANVEVITADVNELDLERRFDRVVSVEMFEHMRNYEALMARIAVVARGRRPLLRPSLLPPRVRVRVRLELDGAALLHRRDDALRRPAAALRPRPPPLESLARRRHALRAHRRGLAREPATRTSTRSTRASAARSSPTGASSFSPAPSSGATATAPSGSSATTSSRSATGAYAGAGSAGRASASASSTLSLRPASTARATSSGSSDARARIDQLAPERVVRVDVDDSLLARVELRGRCDLHGRLGPVLDGLGRREPDQRQPDAADAARARCTPELTRGSTRVQRRRHRP